MLSCIPHLPLTFISNILMSRELSDCSRHNVPTAHYFVRCLSRNSSALGTEYLAHSVRHKMDVLD